MSYQKQSRQTIPCPAGVTQIAANAIRDAKVAFFKPIFTQDQVLTHPKTVYSTIINSPDATGVTLEAQVGTVNAKALMTEIMFNLVTGSYHTA